MAQEKRPGGWDTRGTGPRLNLHLTKNPGQKEKRTSGEKHVQIKLVAEEIESGDFLCTEMWRGGFCVILSTRWTSAQGFKFYPVILEPFLGAPSHPLHLDQVDSEVGNSPVHFLEGCVLWPRSSCKPHLLTGRVKGATLKWISTGIHWHPIPSRVSNLSKSSSKHFDSFTKSDNRKGKTPFFSLKTANENFTVCYTCGH